MTWEKLDIRKPNKDRFPPDEAHCASIGGPNGSICVAFYFGAEKAAELGISKASRCTVERGLDSFYGEVRITLDEQGNRRLAPIGGSKNVYRLVLPAAWFGVEAKGRREVVKARPGPNGQIMLTLPEWARRYGTPPTRLRHG